MVTHPSINRARRRVTKLTLIETNAPLSQAKLCLVDIVIRAYRFIDADSAIHVFYSIPSNIEIQCMQADRHVETSRQTGRHIPMT